MTGIDILVKSLPMFLVSKEKSPTSPVDIGAGRADLLPVSYIAVSSNK